MFVGCHWKTATTISTFLIIFSYMYTYTFNEFTQETSSTTATLEYLHHQNWNTKHRCLDQMDTLYLWGACIYGMLINAYFDHLQLHVHIYLQ